MASVLRNAAGVDDKAVSEMIQCGEGVGDKSTFAGDCGRLSPYAPRLHQAGRYDSVSALYSFRHRNHSPTLGRWARRDPMGYVDGMSLYEYVQSQPIDGVDPSGTFTIEDPGKRQLKVAIDQCCKDKQYKGTVEVNNEVGAKTLNGNPLLHAFSATYTGTNSADCQWVQFVWSEVITYDKNAVAARKTGTISRSIGRMKLSSEIDSATQNPTPIWYLDSSSDNEDPAYISMIRKPNSVTMVDRPEFGIGPANKDYAKEMGDGSIGSIRGIDHFQTFLVCNKCVIFGFEWTHSETWQRATKVQKAGIIAYSINISSSQTGTLLPTQGQYDDLKARFPNQNLLPIPVPQK